MAHGVADKPSLHMGLPLPHGKLAMWLFMITEIMFFTGLIGVYLLLRNGTPTPTEPWPTPHEVHLEEIWGAINTFVLICSSLTVVLAHHALGKNQVNRALQYIAISLALGFVFLGIKAYEYVGKFNHGILPGYVPEKLDGPMGPRYLVRLEKQLKHIVEHPAEAHASDEAVKKCKVLLDKLPTLTPKQANEEVVGSHHLKKCDEPPGSHHNVKGVLEEFPNLHLAHSIPFGNLWASCYFALTGFHALHVIGGLVIFIVMLVKGAMGTFGPRHEPFVEYTGLYWHFVDIVWIFLFPLMYFV